MKETLGEKLWKGKEGVRTEPWHGGARATSWLFLKLGLEGSLLYPTQRDDGMW